MAIKKVSNCPLIYKGFIIESKSKIVNGFCNLTLEKSSYKKFIADYTNITWNYRIFTEAYLKTKRVLMTGPYGKWLKMGEYKKGVLENYNEFVYKPSIKVLDQSNILVTMSDFGGKNYLLIDSLVKANADKISQAKNLIIDIRNNAGGYINCYFPFIPYVCTSNIIHDASNLLCSNEIISDMEETVKLRYNKGDTIKAREYEEELLKMKNKKGDFLFYKGDTLKCSLTNKFPKNVAIITNHACMSAAELMVLDFKQSSKVKIFGERTGGALDYLNFMRVKLPSNRFSFRIATVKRITNKVRPKFDNIGLIPDIEITDNVSDWVEFVKEYYEKN
jgi:hypothetical protein